jgi:hypothetical protein
MLGFFDPTTDRIEGSVGFPNNMWDRMLVTGPANTLVSLPFTATATHQGIYDVTVFSWETNAYVTVFGGTVIKIKSTALAGGSLTAGEIGRLDFLIPTNGQYLIQIMAPSDIPGYTGPSRPGFNEVDYVFGAITTIPEPCGPIGLVVTAFGLSIRHRTRRGSRML